MQWAKMRWGPEYRLAQAYQTLFMADNGALRDAAQVVLADLGRFCCGFSGTTVVSANTQCVDQAASNLNEGRREVLMRLYTNLNLPLSRLIDIENAERNIQENMNG
jgi:hypothetical protein